jgi:hypothetical protein
MGGVDWAGLALVSRLEQWLTAHPHRFVVSTARLLKAPRGAATTVVPSIRPRDSILGAAPQELPTEKTGPLRGAGPSELPAEKTGAFRMGTPEPLAAKDRGARPLVLPVRKVQTTFPSMITVGRTDNNDLVVPDEQVSKFHAFFRIVDDAVQLFDAGSRNGTFIGGVRLQPRSAGTPLRNGDRFSLAAVEMLLLDSRGFWEWVRQLNRFA